MEHDILENIAGTLRFGWFSGESFKKQLIAYLAMTSIFCLGIILSVVLLSIEQVNNPAPIASFIGSVITCIIGLMIIPVVFMIFIIKNYKRRKVILLWLQDAVEIKAYAKTLSTWGPIFEAKSTRLQVNFTFNGKKITKISQGKQLGVPDGYHRIWTEYADKEINILYSPKYDEVMILKNSAAN